MSALRRITDSLDNFQRAKAAVLAADWPAAREICGAMLVHHPRHAAALHLLATAAIGEGKLDEGVRLLRRAIALQPSNARWRRDLGVTYFAASDYRGALRAFYRSLQIDPSDASALATHARALAKLERWEDAAAEAESALSLDPNAIPAHRVLAEWHARNHCHDRVLPHRLELVRLRPGNPEALMECAIAHYHLGETARAVEMFRELLAGDISAQHHSLFLATLLHDPSATAEVLRREHGEWARRHAVLDPVPAPKRPAKSSGRLRIAYLCAEPGGSPVFRFLTPLLRHHDRRKFDVHLSCTDPSAAGRYKEFCVARSRFHDMSGIGTHTIAQTIRGDGADILVDVSGHYTGGNMFIPAYRAAPVQVAYPHYPATTGLPQMDYIFTDRWTCPPGHEAQYTERPYPLDSGYMVFDPPSLPRGTAQLPALRNGRITFGVFQRPAKLSPQAWDAIAAVLQRVRGSRLLVHFTSADLEDRASGTCRRIIAALEARGVSGRRVSFAPLRRFAEHIRVIAGVDIALDSFPYTGQTTTCECLAVGVPVVTLAGATHVSRLSAGILLRLGLNDWVAESVDQYVDITVRLAADVVDLARRRRQLRRTFRRSNITDGPAVTRCVERAYLEMVGA